MTPTAKPSRVTTGPPLLPGFTLLVICRYRRAPASLLRSAEMAPGVVLTSGTRSGAVATRPTSTSRPNGYPSASTASPGAITSESPRGRDRGCEPGMGCRPRGLGARRRDAAHRRGLGAEADVDARHLEREGGSLQPLGH